MLVFFTLIPNQLVEFSLDLSTSFPQMAIGVAKRTIHSVLAD